MENQELDIYLIHMCCDDSIEIYLTVSSVGFIQVCSQESVSLPMWCHVVSFLCDLCGQSKFCHLT